VWKYEDGSDLAYFDGLSDTILSVGLVTPRPGILQPHIKVFFYFKIWYMPQFSLPTFYAREFHTVQFRHFHVLLAPAYSYRALVPLESLYSRVDRALM
jgi:hypothetical protein